MGVNKRRRESTSALVYVPVAVFLISALVVLGVGVFLRVVKIEVAGASKYAADQIAGASGIKIGDNLLFLDKSAAAKSIRAAMPYISEVSIETRIPDKVVISVRESFPFAMIQLSSGTLLIDSSGRILETVQNASSDLINIRGFTPASSDVGSALKADAHDETRLRCLLEVMMALDAEGIGYEVSFIDVSNIVYISFQYRQRFTVMLGTTDNLGGKMGTLSEAVKSLEETRPATETGTIYLSDREPWRWSPDR